MSIVSPMDINLRSHRNERWRYNLELELKLTFDSRCSKREHCNLTLVYCFNTFCFYLHRQSCFFSLFCCFHPFRILYCCFVGASFVYTFNSANGSLFTMKNSSSILDHRNLDNLLVSRNLNASQFPSSSVNLSTEQLDSTSTWWRSTFFPDDYVPEDIKTQDMITRIIGVIIGCLIIVATVFGNVLVIMVVHKYRRMKSITNILLASLASADITVAILVMPFLLVYDYLRFWPFRSIPCHFWISCDVMCCTSSILHLCAIALDRYCAITNPLRYKTSVNRRNLYCNIMVIWVSSITISFVPIFSGWYHAGTIDNILTFDHLPDCELKVNRVYAIVSSSISFYVPLIVMFYVYMRILIIAEEQSRQIKQVEYTLKESSSMGSTGYTSTTSGSRDSGDLLDSGKRLKRKTKQLLVETKAIRTLGIIMGVFCACWLPFFIYYLIEAYCDSCQTPYEVKTGIQWLGYLNSSLNPLIYAFCNQDFKNAFRQILFNTPSYLITSDTCHDETSSSTKSQVHGRFDKQCEVVALRDVSRLSSGPSGHWISRSQSRSTFNDRSSTRLSIKF